MDGAGCRPDEDSSPSNSSSVSRFRLPVAINISFGGHPWHPSANPKPRQRNTGSINHENLARRHGAETFSVKDSPSGQTPVTNDSKTTVFGTDVPRDVTRIWRSHEFLSHVSSCHTRCHYSGAEIRTQWPRGRFWISIATGSSLVFSALAWSDSSYWLNGDLDEMPNSEVNLLPRSKSLS